jgi:hypothetical protein
MENGVVVLDGPLAHLIHEEGDDSNINVYLNPADVEAFKAKWCGRRIHSDPNQLPGRVRVMQGDDCIAQGSISNLACIARALSTHDIDVYLHPDDHQDFNAWLVEEQDRKRRMN